MGDPLINAWDKLIAPWLDLHASSPEARHLLYSGLRELPEGEANIILDPSHRWLDAHLGSLEASFVLQPLLDRQDLGDQAQPAIQAAVAWLEEHFLTQDAEFVLKNLLGKTHLPGDRKEHCITLALKRLDEVIETAEASFILDWCLRERILSGEHFAAILQRATKWLQVHGGSNRIDFVFKRLLRNPNLEDTIWREVADCAFAWLKRTPLALDRDYALNSLLVRLNCLEPEQKAFILQDAQEWLRAFPGAADRERLLANLNRLTQVTNDHNASSVLLTSMETQSYTSLSNVLRENVRKRILPESTQLHEGLRTACCLLNNGRPGSAAYYLSSLLPLASLKGDAAFANQVIEAIRLLLAHPDLTEIQRRGFSRALYQLLDEGLWPNREQVERLLLSLEIHRPSDV
jgi:hypothetical protein